jgi:PAS domain S-box-containing protein
MGDRTGRDILIYLIIGLSGLFLGMVVASYLSGTITGAILPIVALVLTISAYSILRLYLSRQRRMLRDQGQGDEETEVGFVVDTFHELVSKLKEKERELARLKAQAEERAGMIEAYSDNILQSIPSGVISMDNEMRIRSINRAAEQILGLSSEDVVGMDSMEVFGEPIVSILRDKRSITRAEYPYTARDGRHLWLGVTTSQLRNKSGEAIGMLLIFTDLTDIKALQEEVRLKERLSQLGEMSAGIAHELRNSMSVIAGYARLLKRNIDEANRPSVESILSEIRGMDMVISELLSFAKPTVLNKTTVDLNRLIEDTASAVVGDRDSIRLSIKTHDTLMVKADETLLRQAITNLLVNAIESMPDGGMLDVETSLHGEMAMISIRDTGTGIADDIRDKVFLPFFSTKEKGTGLGLALVQKIIVAHNGRVEFESNVGKGTVFKISLPVG